MHASKISGTPNVRNIAAMSSLSPPANITIAEDSTKNGGDTPKPDHTDREYAYRNPRDGNNGSGRYRWFIRVHFRFGLTQHGRRSWSPSSANVIFIQERPIPHQQPFPWIHDWSYLRDTRKLSNRTQWSRSSGAPEAERQKPRAGSSLRSAEWKKFKYLPFGEGPTWKWP